MTGRVAVCLAGFAVVAVFASPADAALDLKRVGSFDSPTYLAASRDDPGRKFVTEREGVIRVIVGNDVRSGAFLNIKGRVSTKGEGGLLSMAFAPDYGRTGRFYVYYVDRNQDIRVDQFRARTANRARPRSRRTIIRIPSPPDTHKGGQLQMTGGGYLLLATGDGGNYMNPSRKAQSRTSLLGKLLRIKPAAGRPRSKRRYTVHPRNPFAGRGRRGHGAILSLGLRNPWRFSLDRNRVLIGDVGHSRTEEVNSGSLRGLRGANFGWPCFEGSRPLLGCRVRRHRKPLLTYDHSGGNCSIIGGYVNRARGIPGRGRYLFGDYCSGRIWSASLRNRSRRRTPLRVHGLVSFGEDARGNLYTVSLHGAVRRLVNR